jgi:hypothetical protein
MFFPTPVRQARHRAQKRIVARALIDARWAVLEAEDGTRARGSTASSSAAASPTGNGRFPSSTCRVTQATVAPLLRESFSIDTLMGILDRALLGGPVEQAAVRRYSTVTDFARFLG